MDNLLLTMRLILALVFFVAGVMKLADLVASSKAMHEFGLPDWLAKPVGFLLPLIEIAVAAALIADKYAWWGAVAALLLLLGFVGAISFNLMKGRTPNCRCFGQLSSGAVGLPTLLRNQMLAAVAGLLIWQGWNHSGLSFSTWLLGLTTSGRIKLVVGLILLALVVAGKITLDALEPKSPALRRLAEAFQVALPLGAGTTSLATRLDPTGAFAAAGLPVGSGAPNFNLVRPDRQSVNLHSIFSDHKPIIMVFVDPDCAPCEPLMPEIARWALTYRDRLSVSLLSRDNRDQGFIDSGSTNLLLQDENEVADAFGVAGYPTAVIIRQGGVISSRLALGGEAISALFASVAGTTVNGSIPHRAADTVSSETLSAGTQSGCRTCGC